MGGEQAAAAEQQGRSRLPIKAARVEQAAHQGSKGGARRLGAALAVVAATAHPASFIMHACIAHAHTYTHTHTHTLPATHARTQTLSPAPQPPLSPGDDVIIGKTVPLPADDSGMPQRFSKRDASTTLRHSESGMVDSVLVTTGADGTRFVKMRVRSIRIPQVGASSCASGPGEGVGGGYF
jgi:hypothetical protein